MPSRVVVGAAIVRSGCVLAARRTTPPSAAGRWEFPGGKVEPGETDDRALVREIREELGVGIRVETWLAAEQPLPGGLRLRVALARLVSGDPAPTEHDELRWLGSHELGSVDWLDGDRPFLDPLSVALRSLGG